jgi:hypothetical protein
VVLARAYVAAALVASAGSKKNELPTPEWPVRCYQQNNLGDVENTIQVLAELKKQQREATFKAPQMDAPVQYTVLAEIPATNPAGGPPLGPPAGGHTEGHRAGGCLQWIVRVRERSAPNAGSARALLM